ncbi:hypothetical protein CHARACLAT_033442 [Characodon lateralis]|uniref:Uncharacterized protein n=1 Tax=Characodon lateralis TaxID=208331 RepID=A0ABU7EHV8_9TELE|nr:hypothetical protein [Characodon lateralis]
MYRAVIPLELLSGFNMKGQNKVTQRSEFEVQSTKATFHCSHSCRFLGDVSTSFAHGETEIFTKQKAQVQSDGLDNICEHHFSSLSGGSQVQHSDVVFKVMYSVSFPSHIVLQARKFSVGFSTFSSMLCPLHGLYQTANKTSVF